MYQFSYAEVMQDSVADAKEREWQVLDRSIELLSLARDKEKYGREAIEALFYTRRVWISFIEDLKHYKFRGSSGKVNLALDALEMAPSGARRVSRCPRGR